MQRDYPKSSRLLDGLRYSCQVRKLRDDKYDNIGGGELKKASMITEPMRKYVDKEGNRPVAI
jgi:hypothetical protein